MSYPDLVQAPPATDSSPSTRVGQARTDTLDLPAVPPARHRRSAGTVTAVLLGAAVAGLVTGAVVAQPNLAGSTLTGRESAGSPATVIEAASVQSFDPSGGSGFRAEDADTWGTQTYRTAEFGNLKPGVGLLLDLGTARELTSVTLPGSAGIAVELRASDEPSQDVDAYRLVDSENSTAASSTLSAQEAGSHRYWLVWVTRLAPSEGGFSATIGTPALEGR